MIFIKIYDIKGKKLADSVSSVGSMLLFLLFLVCSLIIISGAASAYSRISDNFTETFSSSAAVRYISNKLRSGNGSQLYEDGKAVVIDCGSLCCVIYSASDGIYEKYTDIEDEVAFTGGEKIFDKTSVAFSDDGSGLYLISANAGNDVFSAYCRK